MNADLFSAREIADLLGKRPRAVRRLLEGVKPDEFRIVRGNSTAAWRLASLPGATQEALERVRRQRGCRTVEDLRGTPDAWQTDVPWHLIDARQQSEALQTMRALTPPLEHFREMTAAYSAEGYDWKRDTTLQLVGLHAYKATFGRATTPARWQYLFSRTLDRDRGAGQFDRPELFLNGNAARRAPAPATANDVGFESLQDCLSNFADRENPSAAETDKLWKESVALFEKLSLSGRPKRAKRRLLNFLWSRAPFLARTPNALRVNFGRKLKHGGDANKFADGRVERRGKPTAQPYDPEQISLIKVASSELYGGRRAPAVRELYEKNLITDPRIKRAMDVQTSKSVLPASLRGELCDVPAWDACHLGERAIRKMAPTCELRYDGIYSMTCLVGDDGTPNNYVAVPNAAGWFDVIRPQLLVFCDFRTNFIVSRATVPRPQYAALDVMLGFKRALRKYGLPKFILREGGIWRKSIAVNSLGNILAGRGAASFRADRLAHSPAEIEFGLERMNVNFCDSMDGLAERLSAVSIQFRESYKANSKPVEKVIGLLWDLMDKLPCPTGRNERIDCPQSTREAVNLVNRRKASPQEAGMMVWDEWEIAVDATIAKYNATRQEGRKLRNPLNGEPLSPEDAFFRVFANQNDPPMGWNADCEILLTRVPVEVDVKAPNIRRRNYPCGFVQIMGHRYCDEQTGTRIGQKLLAFFDPESPETCTFTDRNMRNPFTVPRLEPTNALYPDEQTATTRAQAHRTLAPVKASYKAAVAKYEPLLRQTLVPFAVKHLTQHVAQTTRDIEHCEERKSRRTNLAATRARKLGLPPALVRPGDDLAAEGLEMMSRAEKSQADSAPAQNGEAKSYALKPFGDGRRQHVDYLLGRLAEFRRAGKTFGQNISGQISAATVARIARGHLHCDLYAPDHFEEVCGYLRAKIDATILGKRNAAAGIPNYHEFAAALGAQKGKSE